MSRLHGAIDFRELVSPRPGQGLEELTRALTERLGLHPEWTGRGADRGRDLILTQQISKPLKHKIRWLVSCKDLAHSGKGVNEKDLPTDITAKLHQHHAQGLLVVTTTTVTSGAKELLDAGCDTSYWKYFTDVWDRSRLIELLLHPTNESLLKQYLPDSFVRIRHLDGFFHDTALQITERFGSITESASKEPLIPGISAPLPRDEVTHVEDQLEAGNSVLLTGEPGTGKSGIGHALCTPPSSPTKPVLFLDAQRYSGIRSERELSDRLRLSDQITPSIRRLGERIGCRLIIDQLDSTSADPAGQVFVDLAIECSLVPGVQVVILSRQRESYERKLLGKLIEHGFIQLPCNRLGEAEARHTLSLIEITNPPDDLVILSTSILNLTLIARIKREQPEYDFSSAMNEVALWQAFVETLCASEQHSPERPQFGEHVIAEAIRLAREGMTTDDRTFLIEQPKTPEQRRLESWQVIIPNEGYRYRFQHETLQDFLYARDAVARGWMPEDVLGQINQHRTRSILPWMNKLYIHLYSPKRSEFLRRLLSV